VKLISTGIFLVLFDLSFASLYNERNLLHAFEHGSCPEPEAMQNQLIYREAVIKKLRRILEPIPGRDSYLYHTIVGNTGTGMTTVVRQCAKDVGKGVIYVDVPPVLDEFNANLEKAIRFTGYMSITESLVRKIQYQGNDGMSGKVIVEKKYWCLLCTHFLFYS